MKHPNIVKYYQAYEGKDALYLCMELCRPNEVKNRIMKSPTKSITERKAAFQIKKLLKAIVHY